MAERDIGVGERTRMLLERQRAAGAREPFSVEERLALLAEAGARLLGVVTVREVAERLARLGLPRLGDCCLVDLVEEPGGLERVAAHVDPDEERRLRERLVGRALVEGPVVEVLRTGEGRRLEAPPELREALDRPLGSTIVAPLSSGTRTLGALTYAFADPERRHGESHLALAVEIGRRAAAAVEDARRSERERRARLEAERLADRAARLQSLAAALAAAVTPNDVLDAVMSAGMAALDAPLGSIVLLDESRTGLETVRAVGIDAGLVQSWRRFPLDTPAPIAEAVRTGQPVVIRSAEECLERYPNLRAMPALLGSGALAALPLLVHGRTLGAIGAALPEGSPFAEDRASLLELARLSAQSFERATLYESQRSARAAAARVGEQQTLLADVASLLAGSLDEQLVAARLAQLVVPRLADVSVVYLADGSRLRRAGAAAADPAKEPLLGELDRYPVPELRGLMIRPVVENGRATLLAEVTEQMLREGTADEWQLALMHRLAPESAICVPLRAGGRVLGALLLAAAESHRRYGDEDLAHAEQLADRAAHALDVARRFAAAAADRAEALRESAAMRALADASPAILFTTRADGTVDWIGARFRDLTGAPVERARGWDWIGFIHVEDLERCVSAWRRAIETGEPLVAEARVRAADGRFRRHLVRATPRHDERGAIERWYGILVDLERETP